MKKISVVIACCNEQDNILPMVDTLSELFSSRLSNYEYEIIFIDNDSTDLTRLQIEKACQADKRVKAVFNARNFGSIRSSVYGLLSATGDCIIKMCADFEDPPELIYDFVERWEKGTKIVIGIKSGSKENLIMRGVRALYYRIIERITEIKHIRNFVGYGLYDKDFIEIIRELKDPIPYFRGLVAELGFKYEEVYYVKPVRRSGKSKFNFYRLYDYAMLGITAYSKIPLRIMTFIGGAFSGISFLVALGYLFMKLLYWDSFTMGMAPVLIGIFFLGSLQLLFLGIMGEYILNINTRVLNRPLVVEERRLNFDVEEVVL